MKLNTYYRLMSLEEEQYAWDVFKGTLPRGEQVGIGDGLGIGDRPWTDDGDDPDGKLPQMKYRVHLGAMVTMNLTSRTQFGGFGRVCDTFIHELTHVWQYAHGSWVKANSAAAQAEAYAETAIGYISGTFQTGDAYEYKPLDHSKSWDDYNAEQQAAMVEEWNLNGRQTSDDLYPFISEVIRSHGDPKASRQSLAELRTHLYIPAPHYVYHSPELNPFLLPMLDKRYAANDVAGFGGRFRRLEQIFSGLDQLQARELLHRLKSRKKGDRLSMYFHDRLSTATRQKLYDILLGAQGRTI